MDMEMCVLLPEKRSREPQYQQEKKYPVLYLLHGHSDDHTAYIRKSLIELLVRDQELIVVMPCAHRSFYTDAKQGHLYYSYITRELPVVVANFFPASTKPEDTYIAGISMGGYGAMKIALNHPEKYRGVGIISGAVIRQKLEEIGKFETFTVPDFHENLRSIFGSGEAELQEMDDLLLMVKKRSAEGGFQPQLYHCCGTEDKLYSQNTALCDVIQQAAGEWHYTFEDGPGDHNWEFWNEFIPKMLTNLKLI